MRQDYDIVTISNKKPTQWYYLYDQFFKSVEGNRCILIQGGYDYGEWKGLTSKPKWLLKAIKDKILYKKYIIFTDCWDMLFVAPATEIITRFVANGSDLIISAERNCFPADLKDYFDAVPVPSPYKYVNSGFIVAHTEALLTCLESMDLDNVLDDHWDAANNCAYHGNDQYEWMKTYFKQPVNISMDYKQEFSMTLHGASIEYLDFSEPRIRNVVTGSYPCSLHFNGSSKDNLEIRNPILQHLKYMQ